MNPAPEAGDGVSLTGLTKSSSGPGGSWFRIASHGFLFQLARVSPSYWLVRAAHAGIGQHVWPLRGWLVIAGWTVVLVLAWMRAYQRDTGRVQRLGYGLSTPRRRRGPAPTGARQNPLPTRSNQ